MDWNLICWYKPFKIALLVVFVLTNRSSLWEINGFALVDAALPLSSFLFVTEGEDATKSSWGEPERLEKKRYKHRNQKI